MKRLVLALLLILLLAEGAGAAEDKKVLVLQSYQRDFSWSSSMERGIEEALKASGLAYSLFVEYLDAKRGEGEDKLASLEEAYRLKYGGLRLDCILAVDNAALAFLNARGSRLFPGAPVVFCGINGWSPELVSGLAESSGVVGSVDYLGSVELARKLLPGLERFVLLSDYSSSGRLIAQDARAQISAGLPALELIDPPDLPASALAPFLRSLGPGSAVLVLAYVLDGEGRVWKPEELLPLLAEESGLPLFTSQDVFFVPGVIGGMMTRGYDQGRAAGEIAIRILGGSPASSIPLRTEGLNRPLFHWRELKRAGLRIGALPPGTELVGKPQSFVEREPRAALAIGLGSFLLLILALVLGYAARTQRKARLSIEGSEERLRLVIEATSDAVWDYDIASGSLYVSPRFWEMSGYERTELPMTYAGWQSLLHPADRAVAVGALLRQTVERPGYGLEYRIRTKAGAWKWIHERGAIVARDPEGRPTRALGVFSDIDERREAQARLETQARELAAKNQELERFTYTVSHDLKSPLITIKGFLSFLVEDFELRNRERFEDDLGRISRAADRMQELLGDLLELSRIGRLGGQPTAFSAGEAVELALENLEGLFREAAVELKLPASWPEILADKPRIVEVFQNLLENAAKYAGEGRPRIEVGWDLAGGEPRFFVRDRGLGIEPAYFETVFGLFNKLDPSSEGTGIGLALVRRIVELHGGRAWVESEGLGKGSTFWFSLPGALGD